jgi:tRNA (guanine26-N2/guanine27-N2)-dimethyltransferase
VFYNPAMATDRDIGVAVLSAWAKRRGHSGEGWEMLAATGVRGLRLLNESAALSGIDLTEANPDAFEVLARNAARFAGRGARAHRADAREDPPRAPYDYIELDPYGSPLPFLGSALRALSVNGLLGVTATDLMVLAGPQPEVCLRKYGARPLRGWLGPEGGLRILIAALARAAREEGRGFRLRLAYVLGHHLRVYAELPQAGEGAPDPVGTVGEDASTGPPLGGRGPFGPLWTGRLFDRGLLADLAVPAGAADPQVVGRLFERWREEAEVDATFAYEPNRIAASLGLPEPPAVPKLLEQLRSRGFAAARSHITASAFRTSAPRSEVEAAARRALGPARAS